MSTPRQLRVLGALVALLFAGGLVGLATQAGDDDGGDGIDTAAISTSTSISGSTSTSTGESTTSLVSTSTSAVAETTTSTTVAAPGTGSVGASGSGNATDPGSGSSSGGGGSGLGASGSGTVPGSDQMADTGAEDLLVPGLFLVGLALASRRLAARVAD